MHPNASCKRFATISIWENVRKIINQKRMKKLRIKNRFVQSQLKIWGQHKLARDQEKHIVKLVLFVSLVWLVEGMATIKRFEDLECWQAARELTKYVYELTKKEKFWTKVQRKKEPIKPIKRIEPMKLIELKAVNQLNKCNSLRTANFSLSKE